MGNRKWTKRDGGTGDVFGYDLNDQVTATLLDIANPDTTAPGSPTINYDANGNRTTFSAYGPTDTYTTNNLNQYSSRNSSQATYDNNGNMTTGMDGLVYSYDAQNRLLSATKNANTETYAYDGLNRQVSCTLNNGPVYKVYDGWDLIAEYAPGATSPSSAYLSGAGGLVKSLTANRYYYQDGSGSTSHLADSAGNLLEWYRYDLQGTPIFYNAANSQIPNSSYGIRHLFTGQQWYKTVGLYDLRNRFYSPDIGRFLQTDPSGFNGDATNLYRYCGNNPVKFADPTGLERPWPGYPGPYDSSKVPDFSVNELKAEGLLVLALTPFGFFDFWGAVTIDAVGVYLTVQVLNHPAMPVDEMPSPGTLQNPPPPPPPITSGWISEIANNDGYNTYDASSPTGSAPSTFNYVVMSDGTVYKYDSDWNYVGHIDGNSGSRPGSRGASAGGAN